MNRRTLLLASTIALLAGAAVGGEPPAYPHGGVVYDVQANQVIRLTCEPPVGTTMTCAMSEVDVAQGPDAPVPLASLPDEAECATLPAVAAELVDGVAPAGVDAQAFGERHARQPAAQQADVKRLVDGFRDYCAKIAGSAERLAGALRDKERQTCTATILAYRLDFARQADNGRWESRSEPDADQCQTLTVAGFERPAGASQNAPWTYRISTRPGSDGAAATCPTATQHLYISEPADIYAPCTYLRFQD